MKNSKVKIKVHFIGVAGTGVSVLAKVLLFKGFIVSGSDVRRSDIILELEKLGLKFYHGHNEFNVDNADVVVYSSAIKSDNSELKRARFLKKAVYSRAELLGLLINSSRTSVGVAGSHGKTTTTCMLSYALKFLGVEALCLMGGEELTLGNLTYSKTLKNLICEVCEYNKNIANLSPTYPVVLNVDNDHLDCYKTIENLKEEFFAYLKRGNLAFINADDKFLCSYKGKKVTFAINSSADFNAKNLREESGKYTFDVYEKGKFLCSIKLNVYGEHNVYNALAVIAILRRVYKVKPKKIADSINSFKGVKRRFESADILGKKIIFDYCHHPTEIKATIIAMRQAFLGNVLYVFEPHTYSRTALLINDFISVFKGENVVFYKTFPARENYLKRGSAKTLAGLLNAPYFKSIGELKKHIKNSSFENVVIMGAGELYDKLAIKKG